MKNRGSAYFHITDLWRDRHGVPELAHKRHSEGSYPQLTEKKLNAVREEAELARQQLQDAIESISEGIVLFDKDGHVILCDSNYLRYFTG